MLKPEIFIKAIIIALLFISVVSGKSQNNISTKTFIFNKADIESIYFNDNKELKIEFSIVGFSSNDEAKLFKQKSSINKIKIKKFTAEKTSIVAVFKKNIDDFRNLLEQNGITQITVNGIKINTSNLISQEKALVLSQAIIDVPPMQFQASYNTADNLGHFEFNVYYFETKLVTAMKQYSINLLLGHINKLQDAVKNAKEEKEDFIKQHSK